MSKKKILTIKEQLARFHAIQNRVINERLGVAPRGVPKRLLRAIAKEENIAVMYPTRRGDWLFVAADDGTYGQTELTQDVFIAVLVWRLETERILERALKHEGL